MSQTNIPGRPGFFSDYYITNKVNSTQINFQNKGSKNPHNIYEIPTKYYAWHFKSLFSQFPPDFARVFITFAVMMRKLTVCVVTSAAGESRAGIQTQVKLRDL